MSSVGAYLRQLREARGVSLEEIARATRVNSSYLHALEADDHGELPVPVFTRGFIRAYCQTVGEPPDQALALYAGRGEVVAAASAPSAPVAPRRPVLAPTRTASEPLPRNRSPVLVSFILLVVLGVALFAVTLALQSGRESGEDRRAARPVTPPPAPRAAEPPPMAASVSPPDSRVPTPTNEPGSTPRYRLVARTVEPTWMRVRTGDGRTMEATIPAGQMREWFSPTPFTLTIGNAGGVRLELNGRELPPLGPSGTVIPRLVVPTESP